MIIYPAMDLIGGRVVRLRQGRFDDVTVYSDDPAEALRTFADAGARWAHVVDLDGARTGTPIQHDLIIALAGTTGLDLQVGGGLRTREQVAGLLDGGVSRVVIGSLAVKQPDLVSAWLDEFGPERLTLSVDVRMSEGAPIASLSGWTEASELTLWDVTALHPRLEHLLLTDIARDGMLGGPNFELLKEASARLPQVRIQASGGISSLGDLRRLSTDGAIVGKALWEGRIDLKEALSIARS